MGFGKIIGGVAFHAAAAGLVLAGAPVVAAEEQAAPVVPDIQTLGASLIAAINGLAADRAAWIDRNMSARAREAGQAAEMQALLDRFGPLYGPLAFKGASLQGSFLSIAVDAPARKREGRITLLIDRADAGHVAVIWDLPFPKGLDVEALPATLSLQEAKRRIAAQVEAAARADEFSGAVLVTRGGKTLYSKAAGFADRDFAVPNAMDTRFHLGSMDKMFTATAIAQLIEAGKLSFDTRLIDVLPDYPNAEAARKITIAHLLTHRAGLGMLWDRKGYDRLKPYDTVAELLPMFAAEPLLFQPGEGADYSNEGFIVLGAVIEKLSGQSYYDYVQQHIFDPAGMTDTGYPRLDEIAPRRAVGYMVPEDDPLGLYPRRPNWTFNGYRGNSCGGGYSTAADMTRFLRALKAGTLVSPAMVERIIAAEPASIPNYGMGFQVMPINNDMLRGHDGGGPHSGVNSFAKMLWKGDYVVAVMGNYDAPFAQNLGGDIVRILDRLEAGEARAAQKR
ncbi:MAG TPA: serine hydrolase domain-containing protein [Allosphingosinicella sp.]